MSLHLDVISAGSIVSKPDFPEAVLGREATLATIKEVLRVETRALLNLHRMVAEQQDALEEACSLIRHRCTEGGAGRLILTGIGKAGKIADKLAATFASTGTPSFFLHPAEARHGDLGMIGPSDVVLALSNSGASEELVFLIPAIRRIGATLISMVGRTNSTLALQSDLFLSIGEMAEACPLGLAPSASTTALLALGDALALTIQRQRRFTPSQYARFHPGGALGRKLMTCGEVMRIGERVPTVSQHASLMDCLKTITRVRAGCVILIDDAGQAAALFTDGDLRRLLTETDTAVSMLQPVLPHANRDFIAVASDDLVSAALHLCSEKRINEVPVLDGARRVLGLIDLQDLADRGFDTFR